MDAKKMKNVNVILNSRDSTGLLKLARHGLEVRNDSGSFESIRASCFVTEGELFNIFLLFIYFIYFF